jgi:uncharacterized protein
MTNRSNREKASSRHAKAAVQSDKSAWFQQVAILSFAALILAVTVVAASMAGAADEATPAEATADVADTTGPSEATGHDLYRRGHYEEAIEEWTKAADRGDAGAAFRLGEEYFDAKVVERDIGQAVKYLKLGADGGDDRAQHDLATLYDNGWGVEASIEEAAKWYLAAAQQGSAVAQYNIATMYQSGAGVEQNIETAYMYFLLAIEGGFPHFATTELANISKEMTAQQIKDATVRARQFAPTGSGAEEQEG